MSPQQLQVAVIIASVRHGRFGQTVADWFIGEAKQRDDVLLDVIDLADFTFPVDMSGGDEVAAFNARIAAAEAFVVVTPEYNHSYPGQLKTALDSAGKQWQAKPVGLVSYGGISGGLRAIEALRPIFAELHTVTIRETVSFHQAGKKFDSAGVLLEPAEVTVAANVFLDQLSWWGYALRAARAKQSYGTVAK